MTKDEEAHRKEYELTRAVIHGANAPAWDDLPEECRAEMRAVHENFWNCQASIEASILAEEVEERMRLIRAI